MMAPRRGSCGFHPCTAAGAMTIASLLLLLAPLTTAPPAEILVAEVAVEGAWINLLTGELQFTFTFTFQRDAAVKTPTDVFSRPVHVLYEGNVPVCIVN